MTVYERIMRRPAGQAVLAYYRRKRPGVRQYILPNKYGCMFMIALAGMLVGSANYNNNLGFLLTFLLGGMAFVSLFHTHANLSGLKFLSIRSEAVFAGDNAAFEITVSADRGRRQAVHFQFEAGGRTIADILPGQSGRVVIDLPAGHRGVFRPGRLKVWSSYPFGLFRTWLSIDLNAECLVYPRPVPGLMNFDQAGGGPGNGDGGGPGVDDFKDIRPYQAGDAMQRIAWKQSSRGQGLLTKEFQGQAGAALVLDFDRLGPMGTEEKLSRLCAMVLAAHNQGRAYGLRLPGRAVPPATGDRHQRECLEALALFGLPS